MILYLIILIFFKSKFVLSEGSYENIHINFSKIVLFIFFFFLFIYISLFFI